ncbi:GSCOCG00005362001-RA-CDS [Cotesia congregata]|nr:GSCOCG00005362001-RA-CDS [Cotesia congregata]
MVVKRPFFEHINYNCPKRIKREPKNENKKQEPIKASSSNNWAESLLPSLPEEIQALINDNEVQNVIDKIIQLNHLSPWAYDCLSKIAQFNPLIIEEKLSDVFKKILLSKKVSEAEKSSYSALLLTILEACARLRRETKLVPWILMALDTHVSSDLNQRAIDILPSTFIEKFTLLTCNMTHSQIISVLMSFIYHIDLIKSQSSLKGKTILIDTVGHLLVAFFDGVHILSSNTPENMQKKFIDGLIKLGNILKQFVAIAFTHKKSNEIIIESILVVIKSWKALIASIKKYSDALTEDLMTSVRQIIDDINQLVNTKDLSIINKNIIKALVACQLEDDKINNTFEIDNKLSDNLDNCWEMIIEKYPATIARMNELQINGLARLLLANTHFSVENLLLSTPVSYYHVQNDKPLVIQCVYNIFHDLNEKMRESTGTTKKLLEIISKKKWKSKRIKKILTECKEIFYKAEWLSIDQKFVNCIVKNLQILGLKLPLMYLTTELRTVIFLIIFAIKKEGENYSSITDLSLRILSDVSENSNIDILQYLDLELLVNDLLKYESIRKIFEYSLRNVNHYEKIGTFVKDNKNIVNCAAPILIECLEKVRSKIVVKTEKIVVKKLQKKLCKRILKSLEGGIKSPYDVKSFRAAVKVSISTKKVDDSLLEKIKQTIDFIFGNNIEQLDLENNPLVDEGLQLIQIILLHRANLKIDDTIVKCIWSLMMRKNVPDIVYNLINATPSKVLEEQLNTLEKKTIQSLVNYNETMFKNNLSIWCSIAQTDKGHDSNSVCQKHYQTLMRSFSTWTITSDNYSGILKFCQVIVKAKRSEINDLLIDLIILVCNLFVNNSGNGTIDLYEHVTEICLAFLKHRTAKITSRLPALLTLYRKVVKFVIDESKKIPTSTELLCLVLNTQKLAVAFVKLKKDIARIIPYTIADIIQMYSEGVIPTYIKEPLDDSINIFLSVCDQHAVSLLLRTLPSSMQEIFKTSYDTYTKFYKFTGKI